MEQTSTPQHLIEKPAPTKPALPAGPSPAIQIVWQWATYVLWIFVLFALSVFLTALLDYFFNDRSGSDFEYAVYFFAALLCLTPLAFFTDKMYRKNEPAEKHGFAAVVMVLNAIIVLLAVLGGLITAVVSLVSLLINTTATDLGITIASSLIVTTLGLMLLMRIVNLPRFAKLAKWFPMIVVGVAVIATIFAIAGPFRSLIASKTDRLIERNIMTLDSEIQTYAHNQGQLPTSLSDLSLDSSYQSEAKVLITRNLVTYKPGGGMGQASLSETDLAYELCATFQNAKGTGVTDDTNLYTVNSDHGKGEQCYRLEVTSYDGSNTLRNSIEKPDPEMMIQ